MATSTIPKAVIKEITAIMRSFFWGKQEHTRYMAYISWSKITTPKGRGGLGFTDLAMVNDTLLMKFLWRLASGSEALWVQVTKAKYLPRSELWLSKRNSKCTPFWKAIMRLRDTLLPWVTWKIGDGDNCTALAQPWFEGALNCPSQVSTPQHLKVRDLVLQDTGMWDVNLLISLFGYVNSMHILQNIQPPSDNAGPGRLIFKHATNGSYSVKKAYTLLSSNSQIPMIGDKEIWDSIWQKGNIAPRVRVFLWKLLHDGLPLASTLNRRFPSVSTVCATCGDNFEDVSHLSHSCQLAKACHFAGPLALRTDTLPASFLMALQWLNAKLDEEQWTLYANSLWALWRCRNSKAYGGLSVGFGDFQKFLRAISWESNFIESKRRSPRADVLANRSQIVPNNDFFCFVDGSWEKGWEGGMGICLYNKGDLIEYRSAKAKGCCPVQCEALALKCAIDLVKGRGIVNCCFFSDCKSLIEEVASPSPPINSDWRAFMEVMCIWEVLRKDLEFSCVHIAREHNPIADGLAKLGRTQGWDVSGYTFPLFHRL